MATDTSSRSLEEEILRKYNGDIEKIVHELRALSSKSKRERKQHDYGEVIVELKNVIKEYKVGKQRIPAVNDVSFEIRQGEFVALTGPSGSGKSTLLQLIGALDKPTKGSITVNRQDISKLSDAKLSVFRNRTVGFVFQFFYLQPFLNLQTNLEVPGMFARTKPADRKKRSQQLADDVSLTDRLKHLPSELSGGQIQRAAIARALLNEPKILLADEPTGNLDRTNAFGIMELFNEVREKFNTTVIVVTHDSELAARADREIKIQDGRVV